jgi:hypothetical protein
MGSWTIKTDSLIQNTDFVHLFLRQLPCLLRSYFNYCFLSHWISLLLPFPCHTFSVVIYFYFFPSSSAFLSCLFSVFLPFCLFIFSFLLPSVCIYLTPNDFLSPLITFSLYLFISLLLPVIFVLILYCYFLSSFLPSPCFGFHKIWGIYWLAVRLLASQATPLREVGYLKILVSKLGNNTILCNL